MGLFDSIKDALTTDDNERLEAARKRQEKAEADLEAVRSEVGTAADPASRGRVEKAEKAAADARAEVDSIAAKAGAPASGAADAERQQADAEQQSRADAQAAADAEAIRNVEAVQAQHAQEQAVAPAAEPEAVPAPAPEPVAEPLAAPAAEPELRTYTVVKGDTLSKIGAKFGVKWRDIASLNNVANPDKIYPGQVFRIPNA